MANCVKHPAESLDEAIALTIDNANRFNDVLNGDVNTFVTTCESGGQIPSVSKALAEAAAYKVPLAWDVGQTENDLLQPRDYDGNTYVPLTVPAVMDATPSSSLWRLFVGSLKAENVKYTGLTPTGNVKEALDSSLQTAATLAELPAAADYDGETRRVINDGVNNGDYLSTGGEWVSQGYTIAGGTNVLIRTSNDKLGDVPDLRDYNGTDLTGSNDMSSALQNYINDHIEGVYNDTGFSVTRSAVQVPLPVGIIAVSNIDAKACHFTGKGKWRTRFAHTRSTDPMLLMTGWNIGAKDLSFYDPSGRHSSAIGPCIQLNKALSGFTITTGADFENILSHDINGSVIKSTQAVREVSIDLFTSRMCGGTAGAGVIDIENNAADLSKDVNNIYINKPIIYAHYGPALKVVSDYDAGNQPYVRALKVRGGLIHAGTDEATLTPQNVDSFVLSGFSDASIIGTRFGLTKSGKYAINANNGATARSQSLTIADCEIFGSVFVNNTNNIRIGRNQWVTQLISGWASGSVLTFGVNTDDIEIEREQASFLSGANQFSVTNNSAGRSTYPACSSGSKVTSKTLTVTSGSTSIAVTGLAQPDTDYIPTVTPAWDTTVYVDNTTKNTAGFTVRFGTAPGTNSSVYVNISRAVSTSFVI